MNALVDGPITMPIWTAFPGLCEFKIKKQEVGREKWEKGKWDKGEGWGDKLSKHIICMYETLENWKELF